MSTISARSVRSAAEELANSFRRSKIGAPLRIQFGEPFSTHTGGWQMSVATLGRRDLHIQVWHDKYLDGTSSTYWVGFVAGDRKTIHELRADCPRHLFSTIELGGDDVIESKGVTHLKEIPDITAPIIENYWYDSWWGVYGEPDAAFNVTRASWFVEAVIRILPEFNNLDYEDAYQAVENRRVVALHLRAERDARLARKCKERDDCRCHICSKKFEEEYGSIGQAYAEAHHIVPLSKFNGEVKSEVKHLITVCSNCHKMLHRLKGEAGDVDCLKAAYNNNGGRRR